MGINGAVIVGQNGHEYRVDALTPPLAEAHASALVCIHNIIPFVEWDSAALLANVHPNGTPYRNKWDLSSVAFDEDGEPAGLLVSYERDRSDVHPVDAIYVHRLAVRPELQGIGIGRQMMRMALADYAQNQSHVDTYTVQTNDNNSNRYVIAFYESLGFERFRAVQYPDKLDILLKLSRDAVLASIDPEA